MSIIKKYLIEQTEKQILKERILDKYKKGNNTLQHKLLGIILNYYNDYLVHGSTSEFKQLDPTKIKIAQLGWGFYFTSYASKALDYGNILTFIDKSKFNLIYADTNDDVKEFLKRLGEKIKYDKNELMYDYENIQIYQRDEKEEWKRKNINLYEFANLMYESFVSGNSSYSFYDLRQQFVSSLGMDVEKPTAKLFISLGYDGYYTNDYYETIIFNITKVNKYLWSLEEMVDMLLDDMEQDEELKERITSFI